MAADIGTTSYFFYFLFDTFNIWIIPFLFKTGSHDPNIVPAYKALEIFLGILSKITITGAFIITGYPRNMRDVGQILFMFLHYRKKYVNLYTQ